MKTAHNENPSRWDRTRNWATEHRRILLVSGAVPLVLLVAAFLWVWSAPCWLGGCAPVDEIAAYQAEGSELLDVNGNAFGTLATVNRRIVPVDSLPEHLMQAFLAVEDQRFYDHSGLDIRRVVGASLANLRRGGVAEGGSTISMQLARNLFPDQLPFAQRTIRRKIMEVRVARQLERSLPKEKILELYLNHIYLGSRAYGVEAAARTYFGKPAAELDLAESAMIAGLPAAPSDINPRASEERALERRSLVLRRMAGAGVIDEAAREEADEQGVELASSPLLDDELPASGYFIERVRRALEAELGDDFYTSGLRVHTTLDLEVQQAAEEELTRQLDAIEGGQFGAYAHRTFAETRDDSERSLQTEYLQGMVVVLDARTGAVRALVGGRDYDDSNFDRALLARRQAGSAFKPFVYLSALQGRHPPTHLVLDAPLEITLPNDSVWAPVNYDGRYDGPITLRESITRSKNTATVRLADEVGLASVVRTARNLGVAEDIPELPSTSLGATSVRPVDLVRAYAPFANGGYRVEPHVILRVEDRDGQILWEEETERQSVLDAGEAFVLTSMLRDVVDRGTGNAVRASGFSGPAAGKTGTTNDAADVWFVGYNPELVAGVWIGHDQPRTIVSGATGGTLAAPVWGRMMSRIYAERDMPEEWSQPSSVRTERVDRGTGVMISDLCEGTGSSYTEYFVGTPPGREPCPEGTDEWRARLAGGDDFWGDEAFGIGFEEEELTAIDPDGRGIEWPELEELRDDDDDDDDGDEEDEEEEEEEVEPAVLGDPVQPPPPPVN